jgi:hypothetical protein
MMMTAELSGHECDGSRDGSSKKTVTNSIIQSRMPEVTLDKLILIVLW